MVGFARLRILLMVVTAMLLLPVFQSITVAQVASPHLVVNTARLNVRSGPGVGHGIITSVPGGTELPVTMIGSGGRWYQVTSPVGSGWVHSGYTVGRGDFSGVPRQGAAPSPGGGVSIPAGAPHLVVNVSYLNVRTGPGVGHNVLTTVHGGATLAVTAIDSGGVWYQVTTSAGSGWVNVHHTVQRGNFAGVSRIGAPTTSPTVTQPTVPAGTPHLVVNTAYLNVRTGPGTGYDILTTVRGGTTLAVVSVNRAGRWYQVSTAAGNGWVHSGYIIARGDFTSTPRTTAGLPAGTTAWAVVNTPYLNIRSGPGIGHYAITNVPGGTTLPVLGKSVDRKWYLVEGSFGRGWLRNLYVVFRGDFSTVQVVS